MKEPIITYRSLSSFYVLAAAFAAVEIIVGYMIGVLLPPTSPIDLLAWSFWYLLFPVGVSLLGAYLGWNTKKNAVSYNAPKWELKPVQYRIDEFRDYIGEYHRKYIHLEARSHYWFFHLPVLIVIFLCAFPFYVIGYNLSFATFTPVVFCLSLFSIHAISAIGAFLSTENDGSMDFTLPLVREAIWIAEEQSKITGATEVRIAVDKGIHGTFETVRNPRVVMRIQGIEDDGYIESWSDELRAINRIFCRLNPSKDYDQVVWWWLSRERLFRKYTESEKGGYFVKFPIPFLGRELGVQDVKPLTANAAAIMLLEIIRQGRESNQSKQILLQLGASPENIECAQNARP